MEDNDSASIFPRDPRINENIATLKVLKELIESLSFIGKNKENTRARLANERNMITMFFNSHAPGEVPCMYRIFKKAYGEWHSYESHNYSTDGVFIESTASGLLNESDIRIADAVAAVLEKHNHFIEKPKPVW